MGFLKNMFSETDGSISSARILTYIHAGAVISLMMHSYWPTHTMPDVTVMGGASTFILGPYGVNKFSTMFGKNPGA
jgi:hypothetical protein